MLQLRYQRQPKFEIIEEITEPKMNQNLVPIPEEPKVNYASPLGFLSQLIELAKFKNELKEGTYLGLVMLSYKNQLLSEFK